MSPGSINFKKLSLHLSCHSHIFCSSSIAEHGIACHYYIYIYIYIYIYMGDLYKGRSIVYVVSRINELIALTSGREKVSDTCFQTVESG